MTIYSTLDRSGWNHHLSARSFNIITPVLVMVICVVLVCAMQVYAEPTEAFVSSVLTSDLSTTKKREAINREFAGQPFVLIDIIEGLDEEDNLAFDIGLLCQDGLADMLQKEDCEFLLSSISTSPNIKTRGMLAGVLPRNRGMIEAVKQASASAVKLLTDETESLNAVEALADVLSRAGVLAASPAIRSKLELSHIDFGATISLEVCLIRLGDQTILDKYVELIESQDFIDQSHAVNVFARCEAPTVMKYLISWLDMKVYPKVNARVDPPYRYCDVAVRFANFFRFKEPGPLRLVGLSARQYSDVEIEQVRAWWDTVRDTDEYR